MLNNIKTYTASYGRITLTLQQPITVDARDEDEALRAVLEIIRISGELVASEVTMKEVSSK